MLITFYAVGFVFAIILSLWAYLYAKRTLRDLRARAVAREQVLTAFTFPELMEDDGMDIEMSLERRNSVERRRSFRGARKDLEAREEEDRGLLAETEAVLSDSAPHTPSSSLSRQGSTPMGSRRPERQKLPSLEGAGSLDSKTQTKKIRTIVVADSSTLAENESDDVALLEDHAHSSA